MTLNQTIREVMDRKGALMKELKLILAEPNEGGRKDSITEEYRLLDAVLVHLYKLRSVARVCLMMTSLAPNDGVRDDME